MFWFLLFLAAFAIFFGLRATAGLVLAGFAVAALFVAVLFVKEIAFREPNPYNPEEWTKRMQLEACRQHTQLEECKRQLAQFEACKQREGYKASEKVNLSNERAEALCENELEYLPRYMIE